MSRTDDHETEPKAPLPRPVGEDGLTADREPGDGQGDGDALDAGLAETGGGDDDKRKIA